MYRHHNNCNSHGIRKRAMVSTAQQTLHIKTFFPLLLPSSAHLLLIMCSKFYGDGAAAAARAAFMLQCAVFAFLLFTCSLFFIFSLKENQWHRARAHSDNVTQLAWDSAYNVKNDLAHCFVIFTIITHFKCMIEQQYFPFKMKSHASTTKIKVN